MDQEKENVTPDDEYEMELVSECRLPDPAMEFYKKWGEETEKAVPGQLLDTLKQLTALNLAIIGGSMIGLRDGIMHEVARLIVVAIFVLSMFAAMWGIVPRVRTVIDLHHPLTVKDHKDRVNARRSRWIKASCSLLVLGFVAILVGMAVKLKG